MKLLFLLLLLPACINAQQLGDTKIIPAKFYYHSKLVRGYAKIEFHQVVVYTQKEIEDGNYSKIVPDTLRSEPFWTITYNYFYLHGKRIVVKPDTRKAYSPAGNSLESLDTNHFKVYYIKTDTKK